jgi:hypothetical protein
MGSGILSGAHNAGVTGAVWGSRGKYATAHIPWLGRAQLHIIRCVKKPKKETKRAPEDDPGDPELG